jgi:TM2 domain-containing membrane protein YozV
MYAPASNDAQRMMLYDANKKSAGVAYALWFFFGLFGGHRFYLDRSSTGVVMLCITVASFFLTVILIGFLGFAAMGIWLLIDAFTIPEWIREHNNRLVAGLSQ